VDGAAFPGVRVFVVERFLPGLTPEGVAAQAKQEAEALGASGVIRHIRTTYLCEDELCFSVFEAPSIDAVRAVSERSGLAYERITEAVDVTALPVGDV
jgi:hypothetical protein